MTAGPQHPLPVEGGGASSRSDRKKGVRLGKEEGAEPPEGLVQAKAWARRDDPDEHMQVFPDAFSEKIPKKETLIPGGRKLR